MGFPSDDRSLDDHITKTLVEAVFDNHVSRVDALLEYGVETDRFATMFGVDVRRTALMWACAKGFDRIVASLCFNGANIHLKDSDGNTALHLAARGGHFNSVQMLLFCKPLVNEPNKSGETPLTKAFGAFELHKSVETVKCVEVLLEYGALY